jgi:fido (protein-threonine AMPylation protein)
MSPAASPCPQWEYRNHPQYAATVPARAVELMGAMSTNSAASASMAIDTRPAHRKLFSEVTPVGHDYYAGHYRGEDFPCLRSCHVAVGGMNGELPHRVAFRMGRLSRYIRDIMTDLDTNKPITTKEELQRLVEFISRSFVDFLTVHPYANGNGHAARAILCAIMSHYGFAPVWRIDSRPPEPEYTTLITQHRGGNPTPLQVHILQWIISN